MSILCEHSADGTFQAAIQDKGEKQRPLTRFDFKADFSPTAVGMTVTWVGD
jgi:hypothetical protein